MPLKDFIKKRRSQIFAIAFALILLLGIFLRVYNHHDWLRFNADQSRDALLVNNFLEGKTDLPLLGPKAGGTFFSLGPMFYYFQIVSAKIFGTTPDKMAYPDLLFSILSIPLLYVLMRRYFNKYISLSLVAIFSVSAFAVQYSRFAWNPNSSPFFIFLFLYSLLRIGNSEEKKKILWAAISGITVGIGMQLHTILLVVMPVVTIFFILYLWSKKQASIKEFAVIFLIAVFLNIPQITSEIRTGGQNMATFFKGMTEKTDRKESIFQNLSNDVACQFQANALIISSIGNKGECGIDVISGELKRVKHLDKKIPIILEFLFCAIFSIFGFLLWGSAIKKEKNQDRRAFLVLLGGYALLIFFILVPMSAEISPRFYLALEFVPFVILGMWVIAIRNLTREKYKKIGVVIIAVVFVSLIGYNIFSVLDSFRNVSVEGETEGSTSFITLGETEFISDYIVKNVKPGSTVYIEGRKTYLFKYLKSIEYFTREKDIKVRQKSEEKNIPDDAVIFIIDDEKRDGELKKSMQKTYISYNPEIYGRFSISILERKQ